MSFPATRLNPTSRTLPVLLAMEDDAEDVGRLSPDTKSSVARAA